MQELFFQLIGLLGVRLGVSPVGMVELFVHGASLTTYLLRLLVTTKRHFLKNIADRQNNFYVQFVTSKLFRSLVNFYHLGKTRTNSIVKMSRNVLFC